MARSYTAVDVGIWEDAEFCALTAGAQRTYFMLITQTDISACGSLALTLRRWAKTCSEKYLEAWLAELCDARFVLIDEDTEELLVRTFVKWDGGYKHAKRVMAVIANAKAIRSLSLRDAVTTELAKLGVQVANAVPLDSQRDATQQATDSRRSVVNVGEYEGTPQSTLRESEPSPSDPDVEPPEFCPAHPNGTTKPCGPCGTSKQRHARWAKRQERKRADAARRRSAEVLEEIARAKAQAVPRPKAVSA